MAFDDQFKPIDSFKPKPDINSDDKGNQVFKTPDEVAAGDDHTAGTPLLDKPDNYEVIAADHSQHSKRIQMSKKKSKFSWRPTKKQLPIIILALLVLAGAGYLLFKHLDKPVIKPPATLSYKQPPKPDTVASDLTGLQVNPAVNSLPVTAVMVENSLQSRPQSGLSAAGVVFEAVAEGGVTRFMALYQDTSPNSVGPIRSARPYYIQWSMGFDAGYAHVGGSPDGLADIKSWGVRDLDEFYNGSSYQRISSRQAPHNVYTSISALNQLEDSKGYTSSTYTSWARKADASAKTPTATTVNLSLSGPDYNPTFSYDSKTNTYNRAESGAPQIDANTNAQISPKVVIAIVVPESQGALDASGAYYSNYNVIGSGQADIFQDGVMTPGTWAKSSNSSQLLFTKSDGQSLTLDAGQVWITAVTSPSAISYN